MTDHLRRIREHMALETKAPLLEAEHARLLDHGCNRGSDVDVAQAEGRTYETAEELLARVRKERENGARETNGMRRSPRGGGQGRGLRRRAG